MQLSDGFNAAIEPREAAIVEGMGVQLGVEEADRIGHHLAEFGTRRIQPGLFSIPCDMRGKLPTLQLEIGGKNDPVNLDFNEYILNYVSYFWALQNRLRDIINVALVDLKAQNRQSWAGGGQLIIINNVTAKL